MNDLQKIIEEMRTDLLSHTFRVEDDELIADWISRLEAIAEQEPVAWKVVSKSGRNVYFCEADPYPDNLESGGNITPLYASQVSTKTISVSDDKDLLFYQGTVYG